MPELPPEVTPVRGGPGPFEGSPVTKALLFGSLVLSLTLRRGSSALSALAFATGGEIMVGSLLLYKLTEVERVKGSGPTASAILFAALGQYLTSVALRGVFADGLASGPYGPVFCLVAAFTLTVPSVTSFDLFGVRVTNNAFVYLGAFHLAVSRGSSSLAAGAAGYLLGLVHGRKVPGHIGRLQAPSFVSEAVAGILGGSDRGRPTVRFGRLFGGVQQPAGAGPAGAGMETGLGEGGRQPRQAAEADPQALSHLESMGFDRGLASEALRHANNDLNLAMTLLLGQG